MRPPLSKDDESLLSSLEARKPSELVPIFLELSRRQAARRRPADLVEQLGRDPFVFASAVDLRTSVKLDELALEALSGELEGVLLSPLAPLGTCSLVSPTTQDRSVTTARNNEVVSDPTNVLAIECARRLLTKTTRHVKLATLHQVVRPQRYPANKGWSQHFRLFALAEAGFANAEHAFEVDAMVRHASVFLRLFDLAEEALDLVVPKRRFTLHVADRQVALADRLEARLRATHPSVPIDRKPDFASNYYDGVRLLVDAESEKTGGMVQLGDVGLFDWMSKLTSNSRTRFVAAGLGIQLLSILFSRSSP
jgi:hypothetical protein